MSNYTLRQALEMCRDYLSCIPESAAGGDDDAVRLTRIAGEALGAQDETQPVVEDALQADAKRRDALLEAAINFIGTLTGMEPPPIEVAPLEVFAPFREFVAKIESIVDATGAPYVQPAEQSDPCPTLASQPLKMQTVIEAAWKRDPYALAMALMSEPATRAEIEAEQGVELSDEEIVVLRRTTDAGAHASRASDLAFARAIIAADRKARGAQP